MAFPLTEPKQFSKLPRSKSKLVTIFRQYAASLYSGQRLYSSVFNMANIGSVQEIETFVYTKGTQEEQHSFFALVQEQSCSFQPVNDAILAFIRKYDAKWNQKHTDILYNVQHTI